MFSGNFKLAGLLLVLLVLWGSRSVHGQEARTVAVEVEGTGTTDKEALTNALLNAIQQVCGSYSLGGTLIKDDQIIKDNLYSVSDGVVSNYVELGTTRSKAGLVTKRLRVTVEKHRILANLAVGGSVNNIQDGHKLFSEIVSTYDRETAGRDLLLAMLRSYPESLLEGKIVGSTKVVDKESDRVTLRYSLQVGISPSKYRLFEEKLEKVLVSICNNKGFACFDAKLDRAMTESMLRGFFPGSAKAPPDSKPWVMRVMSSPARENWWTKGFNESSQAVVIVNSKQGNAGYTEWRWFHVPKFYLDRRPITGVVRFETSGGRTVHEDTVQIGPNVPGLRVDIRDVPDRKGSGQATQILVSPFFFLPPDYQTEFVLQREVTLDLDQVRSVSKIAFGFFDTNRGSSPLDSLVKEAEATAPASQGSATEAALSRKSAPQATFQPRVEPRYSARVTSR